MTTASKELGRGSRRTLVVLVYGVYAAIAVGVVSGAFDALILPSVQAAMAGVTAWVGVWALSRMSRHWRWGQAPDERLDEREITMRLRAYHLAYVFFTAAAFLSLVAFSFVADTTKLASLSYAQVSAFLWGVFLVGWTLPSTILAWIDRGLADD